ncbi:hypothetical protein BXZ70DRAFT_930146 [Cristinia sonorae]|uniref:Uncharacterized protein n=1 Tax=Cristinia sonorae TaxID=1940300 RepID=A0A8K0URX3_9AGAR|nr:hypothetical protein BXZ70DRAFT_930146 [Cristinia sonorae]
MYVSLASCLICITMPGERTESSLGIRNLRLSIRSLWYFWATRTKLSRKMARVRLVVSRWENWNFAMRYKMLPPSCQCIPTEPRRQVKVCEQRRESRRTEVSCEVGILQVTGDEHPLRRIFERARHLATRRPEPGHVFDLHPHKHQDLVE